MLKENELASLRALLPRGQVFTDRATLVAYEVDAGLDRGVPEAVVLPRNAEEVSKVVDWAAQHNMPLIARGAGTGLSGGAVADRGGIIVEFAHMDRILDFDVLGRSAVVQPALINLRLDERARPHELYFPPDPSSQRASTIGGNVAENSGGPHCFKYGVTTNYITGLDVVLANGRQARLGGRALEYPGYDLCGLLTGSEGTLALITAIYARLIRNPPGVKTLLAVFDSVEQAGVAVSAVIAAGLVPATMEMMDREIIGIVEPFAHANIPLDAGAVLIIEVDGYPASLDPQMDEVFEILQQYGSREIRIAQDEEERYKIWLARKSAAGAMSRLAPAFYIVDVTVPRSRLAEILSKVDSISKHYNLRSGHVFHAGDGNLHPNILIDNLADPELMARVHQAGRDIVQCSVEMGGSLTGEHGVGIEKREYMLLMHKDTELRAMREIKCAFDPQNIFNPGKIFPASLQHDTTNRASAVDDPALAQLTDGRLNGIVAKETFTPTTSEEAAQGLWALSQAGRYVSVDRPTKRSDTTQISTGALCGIKIYAPEDLYITAGAGTPLCELQEFLAAEGKILPLASPWPHATIGGIVAANNNAPLRMRYGSIRDVTLCATVALADGRAIRTGRPIVKNVAGYDLTKLFVGSHGTLGLLTDISFKIMARPRAQQTLLWPVTDLRLGLIWAAKALPLALTASGITLSKGYQATELAESSYLLAYTAEGMPEDVQAELTQVRQVLAAAGAPQPIEVSTVSATGIWTALLGHAAGTSLKIRAGVPPRDLPAYIHDQAALLNQSTFIADIASGFVYASRPADNLEEARTWLESLRQSALTREGYTIVTGMPDPWHDKIDRWGYEPEGLDVMRNIKFSWDRQGILNPGEFIV
jgi:glycolate oxidase subunit GlcD